MCGFLVTVGLNRALHHRHLTRLRRRGPDAIGFWVNGDVGLAHTRLAILGLDDLGTQPMENERHIIAYNGEIYNFVQIRRRLEAEGIRIAGSSDTEVLLHAWSLWGEGVLTELEGFWSFVVYDKVRRTLSLVRDQFGVKPLYYWSDGHRVCASSLVSALLQTLGEIPALDYTGLSEYVRYQYTFGERTFLEGVKKVLPGHIVEFDLASGEMTSRCYENIWNPGPTDYVELTPEWIEETRDLLKHCVKESTISDTSFTTFCSGGIDSGLITRLAQPEMSYHCNFSDPDCNETFFAQQVVEGTGIRLFVVNAEEEFDLVAKLESIVEDFDELTIGSAILPLDDLLSQVKRRYKVILSGTGGDELFAGYVRYQLALGECHQDSYRALYDRMRPVRPVPDRFEVTHTKGRVETYRFYDSAARETFFDQYADCLGADGDHLSAMLRFDRRHFLPGLLNIDDKLCGRHSMESRPSFLHQRFARHVQCLRPSSMLQGAGLKPVLGDVAGGVLPRSVTHRRDKMGFTTPIGEFVNKNAHQIRDRITSSSFRDLYDLEGMNFTASTKFSREVFGLLMLDLWLNRYARA